MLTSIDTIKTVSFENGLVNKLDAISDSVLNERIQSENKKNSLLLDSYKFVTKKELYENKISTNFEMQDCTILKTSDLDKIKDEKNRYKTERNQKHHMLKNLDPNYAKTFENSKKKS